MPIAKDLGQYLWRGGRKIELKKSDDSFTIMPADANQLELATGVQGVHKISPVTNQVFKVETTTNDRDAAMQALRSAPLNTVAHHVYQPKDSTGTTFYVTDKIIANFKPEATTAEIEAILEKYSLKVLKQYDNEKNSYLLQVTTTSGENPLKISNRLAKEDLVVSAEPNLVNRFMPSFIPPDTYFPRQWHLNSQDGPQVLAAASVNAPAAWNVTKGAREITIALIDDGFDLTHPDFKGVGKVVFPKDYVDGDARPFPNKNNGDYHGTSCAGVAIAEINGKGVVGAAPGCAFLPVRFPLSADDDLLVEIFEETGANADVISCSWGPAPGEASLSTKFYNTLHRLATSGGPRKKGCVICFAAGNYDAPINDPQNAAGVNWLNYGTGQIVKTTGPIINGLATHPDIIAVAASTSLNKHAAYSNWGGEISVCAPSNNFHPLNPHLFVLGLGIWTTDNENYGDGFTAHSRYTGIFGGTSSATPLVAGIAGLVLSANPGLSAAEVKEILQQTAVKILDTDQDVITGVARGGYNAAGHSEWFGYGKVDAAMAVQAAVALKPARQPQMPPDPVALN